MPQEKEGKDKNTTVIELRGRILKRGKKDGFIHRTKQIMKGTL